MKTVSKLSLLAVTLIAVGCNEKVSPELMNGNASVPDGVAVPPSEYYFSITNTSSALLNYNLHKAGAGNNTAACEVRNNTGLSNDIFRGAPATNDISCYFDAEELSLIHAGMSFSVNASPNTCDFVGYTPFSYYNKMPGDSTGSYLEVECVSETTTDAHAAAEAAARGTNITATGGTSLGCGDIASTDINPVNRVKFQIENDKDLCRFNYEDSDGGENCDIGNITINTLSVTFTPGEAPAPDILKSEMKTRVVKCGGKVHACVKGPITELTKTKTYLTEIKQTELNTAYAEEYDLPGLIEDDDDVNYGTLNYANFRRNLASKHINYIASNDVNYATLFGNSSLGPLFDPQVMDFYAANKMFDGTQLVTTGAGGILEQYSFPENKYKAKPLAADPFLGLEGYRVSPFYTFYCFDTAFDIKARIRMVVRDWDRVSPGSQYSDYISDIWRNTDARQDNPAGIESDDEQDFYFVFNDAPDWDDWIPMQRSPGNFDESTTVWQPLPSGIYAHGWFNPGLFPNQ